MPTFKASKIPKSEQNSDDILSIFCYYFPQYSFQKAKEIPVKRIKLMLKAVRKEQARQMVDMMRVMNGSQSKKGADSVLSYFKEIIEG